MLALLAATLSSSSAYAIGATATQCTGHRSAALSMSGIDAPPVVPPLSIFSDGGDDDSSFTLTQASADERRALLSVWAWSVDAWRPDCPGAAIRESEAALMRGGIHWPDEALSWAPLSRLEPRKYDDDAGTFQV